MQLHVSDREQVLLLSAISERIAALKWSRDILGPDYPDTVTMLKDEIAALKGLELRVLKGESE